MGYKEDIQNCQNLDELFRFWKEKPEGKVLVSENDAKAHSRYELTINHKKDYFIADGIVSLEIWNKEKCKILFVLKEAYGKDWEDYILATWLRDVRPKSRIWSRVARWTYGLQRTTHNEICKYKEKLDDNEHDTALKQIAVMNLKKSNGDSQSDYNIIDAYAKFDQDEIKKEFELIDADIIVCGSTFGALYNIVYDKPPLSPETMPRNDHWYYYLNLDGKKERLFIDYYHPSNHWPDLMNYYGLVSIYQQALIEKKS